MRFLVFGLLFISAAVLSESYSIAKRDTQADLLKTITELLTKAHNAVATLEKEGKTALVDGLKKSVTFLMDVEKQLKTLHPTTELGKSLLEGLENLVKQGEAVLEADLKKAQSGFVKRDVSKDQLKKSLTDLRALAKKEIDKLKAEGKTGMAIELQRVDKLAVDLETQLEKLNPTTEVGKALLVTLEGAVKRAEGALEAEIKKLSSTKVKRDAQADLLKTVTDLLTKAHNAIATLEKEGKPALVEGLKKSVTFLMDVEKQLKALHPTTELGKSLLEGLENLVKQGEAVLEADLKKAQSGFVKREATKEELVKDAENMRKLAADAIAKLKSEGKHDLAVGLEKADEKIIGFEKELKNLNPTTEVGKALLLVLEKGLKDAETKLEADIKKLSGGLVKRDTQADLLKTITDLLTKAHNAVATLEKEGKPALVEGLKKSVTFLMDVEKQLRTLHPTTELGKSLLEGLEKLVKQGEAVLEADLKKANGGF